MSDDEKLIEESPIPDSPVVPNQLSADHGQIGFGDLGRPAGHLSDRHDAVDALAELVALRHYSERESPLGHVKDEGAGLSGLGNRISDARQRRVRDRDRSPQLWRPGYRLPESGT